MKNENSPRFVSIMKAFSDYTISEKLVSLGNSLELLVLCRKLSWRLARACSLSTVNLSKRSIQAYSFCKYILIMRRRHGVTFAVSYLKASQLAIQKKIGKDKIESLRDLVPDLPLPRLTSSGLPQYIPLRDRRAICSGSPSVIRWWLTLYSIYRVIDAPSKLKLETITNGFSGSQEVLSQVSESLRRLAAVHKKRNLNPLGQAKVLWLESSSPSSKTSWTGLALDAHLLEHFGLGPSLRFFVEGFGNYSLQSLYKRLMLGKLELDWLGQPKGLPEKGKVWKVGQLAMKKEAAGKIRVFALVDVWTQSVLKPLHLWLFDFLKSLPNDGTFDQHASVKRCMVKVKRHQKSFGYDLSAATDRLPIALQVSILASLFGEEFARNWQMLLVGRDYVLEDKELGIMKLRYAVGQPMGALSSWAMLAVTHHLIVQHCALAVGATLPGRWYTEYELLGDDIILFEKSVADQYLSVMEGLGVGITLSKSVVSTNETIEFAKVTGHNGQNVSAVSWKMFMSQTSIMGRSNICYSLLNKDIVTGHYIAWFKDITRVSKKALTTGYNYSLLAVLSMYVNSGLLPIGNLSRALTDVLNPTRQAYKNALSKLGVKRLEHLLVCAIKKLPFPEFESGNRFWWRDEMSLKGTISDRVENFRLKFDIYKRFTGLALAILRVISKDNLLFPVSTERDSVDLVHRALLEVLIEEWKDPLFKVILSTAALHGVPQYFMLRLSQKQVDQLKENPSTMDTFNWPLEWWLSLEESMDNLMAFGKLVERARKKALETDTVARNKYDSPLKPMKLFLKGRRAWVLKMMGK